MELMEAGETYNPDQDQAQYPHGGRMVTTYAVRARQ
jgi:hypothetical protein